MPVRCYNCNSEISSQDAFCPKCGANLIVTENTPSEPAPVLQKVSTVLLRNEPTPKKESNEPNNSEAVAIPPAEAVNTKEQPPQEPEKPKDPFWICKQCNTINPIAEDYCEVCGAMRVSVSPTNTTSPASVAELDAAMLAALELMLEKFSKPQRPLSEGAKPGWRYYSASGTHEGAGRLGNTDEDSVFTLEVRRYFGALPESFAIYIVADGMGGQAAGEVASRNAIQTVSVRLTQTLVVDWLGGKSFGVEEVKAAIQEAIAEAHTMVCKDNQENNRDSGTTMTACVVIDNQAMFGNVGDSRSYLFRPKSNLNIEEMPTEPIIVPLSSRKTERLNKTAVEAPKPDSKPDLPYKITRVTRDQSLIQDLIDQGLLTVEQAYTDSRRNVVLAALGAPEETIPIDTYHYELKSGDKLFLCSDGLWELMRDETIVESFEAYQGNLQENVNFLIDLANHNGGPDNISVVLVDIVKK